MARLITDHDPFHIHKILGVAVLFHYIYRFYILLKTGKTSFPENESRLQASICVALHGFLSLSSLLLPVPQKRNFGKPMIWPELRLHSIIFASRHVVATLLTLNGLWPKTLFYKTCAKITLVVLTSRLAATVTALYGCNDKRTINAVPYPDFADDRQKRYVKFFYSKAQFVATIHTLEDDPTRNFFPIIAIHLSAFFMTLVRKGKWTSLMFHQGYMISLYFSFIIGAMIFVIQNEVRPIIMAPLVELLIYGRIRYGLPHWFLWSTFSFTMIYVYPTYIHQHFVVDSGLAAVILRFQYFFAVLPLGQIVYDIKNDCRPFMESVKHWPFVKFSDASLYEFQYYNKSAKKMDAWHRDMLQLKIMKKEEKKDKKA